MKTIRTTRDLSIGSLLILVFFSLQCSQSNLNNPCDPKSSSYQELATIEVLLSRNTNSCFSIGSILTSRDLPPGGSQNSSLIVLTSPVLGFTTKSGGSDTFTVRLSKAPQSSVTIPLVASISGQVNITPPSLTFTSVNWNIAQTVNLTGLNDGAPLGTFQTLLSI